MLYDNFLRIPRLGTVAVVQVFVSSQASNLKEQVSRKVAGWRSHIDALDFFLISPCRKDQTKLG